MKSRSSPQTMNMVSRLAAITCSFCERSSCLLRAPEAPLDKAFFRTSTLEITVSAMRDPIPCGRKHAAGVMSEPAGQGGEPFVAAVACPKTVFSHSNHSGRSKSLVGNLFQLGLKKGSPSESQKVTHACILVCALIAAHRQDLPNPYLIIRSGLAGA